MNSALTISAVRTAAHPGEVTSASRTLQGTPVVGEVAYPEAHTPQSAPAQNPTVSDPTAHTQVPEAEHVPWVEQVVAAEHTVVQLGP